jgi:hypothetical protein
MDRQGIVKSPAEPLISNKERESLNLNLGR